MAVFADAASWVPLVVGWAFGSHLTARVRLEVRAASAHAAGVQPRPPPKASPVAPWTLLERREKREETSGGGVSRGQRALSTRRTASSGHRSLPTLGVTETKSGTPRKLGCRILTWTCAAASGHAAGAQSRPPPKASPVAPWTLLERGHERWPPARDFTPLRRQRGQGARSPGPRARRESTRPATRLETGSRAACAADRRPRSR